MVLPRVSDEILNYNGTHCTVILRHISKHSMLSFINQNDPVKKNLPDKHTRKHFKCLPSSCVPNIMISALFVYH